MKLKFGIPIGNLQEATLETMRRAGFNVTVRPRSYYPEIDDPEIEARLLRPQDMSRFVEKGVVDCGLTGNDWVAENRSRVRVVTELTYSKQSLTPFRWVIAVPENSPIRAVKDLQGKRLSTELVNVAAEYLRKAGVTAEVEFSHGATESKAPDLVDAIMDGTETGASLRANKMRIIETVLVSRPQLIAAEAAWADPWKREKMESIAILLEGALAARFKVGLKMNVSKENLGAVLKALPAMRNPTVSGLMGPDMMAGAGYALETIVDESVVRKIIPDLRRAGAEAIVEYPLNKVFP
jgi:ATP phosphoribosyltransferase